MPNDHKDGKKLTTFWLSPEEKENLREAARIEGVDMTEMLRRAISRYLAEHKHNDNKEDDHHESR